MFEATPEDRRDQAASYKATDIMEAISPRGPGSLSNEMWNRGHTLIRQALRETMRQRDEWRALYEQTDPNAPHDLCACRIGQCDRLTVRCREMADARQA